MILGIGLDLVEISRIEHIYTRYGCTFAKKILSPDELESGPDFSASPRSTEVARFLASRFAAKEAVVKALGTGFAKGVTMHDIHVVRLPSGKPTVHLEGKAQEIAQQLGVAGVFLSLTHEKNMAAAMVILESA